jgi:hypothetical protein
MPGRVVKNAPFSADIVTESTQTLPDGNHIRQTNTVKMYRDSEGRTRREQSPNLGGLSAGAAMPSLVFIHDPVAGVSLSLNATDKTGSRSTFIPGRGRGGNGPGVMGVGPRSQVGQYGEQAAARPRRNALPIQIVTETWYSSELQAVVYEKRTDPRYGETIMRFTNISRAEPSTTLFAAPSDYKVTEAARPRPRAGGGQIQ